VSTRVVLISGHQKKQAKRSIGEVDDKKEGKKTTQNGEIHDSILHRDVAYHNRNFDHECRRAQARDWWCFVQNVL
jgi:hypothetical protein